MRKQFWLNLILGLVRDLLKRPAHISDKKLLDSTVSNSENSIWSVGKIIALIEENGGSQGLDLSGQDFRHVDWSAEAVALQLQKIGYRPGDKLPVWVSPFAARGARGLNLKEANLKRANLQYANLHGVDFTRANLEETDLRDTCLQKSNFFAANLYHARLWRADLRRTTFNSAKLLQASLYRAEFEATEFINADLTDAILNRTDLAKVIVHRRSFPKYLIFEKSKEYADLVLWDDPTITPNEWKREVETYLERGREAYRGLKISFTNNGMYRDASWAYIRERILDRKMHGWNQCLIYFGKHLKNARQPRLYKLALRIKHSFIWFWLLLEELTCGYGEKPMRSLALSALVIATFIPLYQASGGIITNNGTPLGLLDYLIYSMSSFATINMTRFDIVNIAAEFLTSLEALFGIAVLALLMFTLGNRISRS